MDAVITAVPIGVEINIVFWVVDYRVSFYLKRKNSLLFILGQHSIQNKLHINLDFFRIYVALPPSVWNLENNYPQMFSVFGCQHWGLYKFPSELEDTQQSAMVHNLILKIIVFHLKFASAPGAGLSLGYHYEIFQQIWGRTNKSHWAFDHTCLQNAKQAHYWSCCLDQKGKGLCTKMCIHRHFLRISVEIWPDRIYLLLPGK